MPESSWCWDLTEGATISINVFLINAITNAIHACTGKTKRTKRTLSELVFNESEVEAIDFTKNGLRPVDKNILLTMVKEYKESDA
ncbi:hypothetical protein ACJHX9_22285 [Escherichia sp. WS1211]|uniref:hypothetical protein n=1 Tax=Escherichia sp. WS1211 TaxID=3381927 RepID=UPI00330EFE5A|nr:hypothetical protein [Escherichia coli]